MIFRQLVLFCSFSLFHSLQYHIEDISVSESCTSSATTGDHLLFEYKFNYYNGTEFGPSSKKPNQLFHSILDKPDSPNSFQVALKGMCENSTRLIKWDNPYDADLNPLLPSQQSAHFFEGVNGISMTINLHHITKPSDYAIFSSFRDGNYSKVIDMISEGEGVNAIDEWGHSTLMIATQNDLLPIIASLLNARRPKVDVNMAKSSGYTALIYSAELKSTVIMQALLRKGADPNAAILQEGSKGNTALHFSCMLEKPKHAELLLMYGANLFAANEFGQQPFDLIPKDSVRSTKLQFKKIFEDAYNQMKGSLSTGNTGNPEL